MVGLEGRKLKSLIKKSSCDSIWCYKRVFSDLLKSGRRGRNLDLSDKLRLYFTKIRFWATF